MNEPTRILLTEMAIPAHWLNNQTVIGLEAQKQFGMIEDDGYPAATIAESLK